jgi:hypothetical protein
MAKIVKLTEADLHRIVKRAIKESNVGKKNRVNEMDNFFNPEAMSTGGAIATMVITVLSLMGFAGSHYIKDMISKLRRKGEDEKADEVEQALQDAMGGETEEMGEQTLTPQDDF